ncbi:hypothetical protein JL720_14572 [Aureococcus anophagefferens]|nr:hypothetical protein JL720_14572 [Aureococcus anophagefferens]
MYYVFFGESPPPPVAEAACDVVPDLAAYALAPLSLGAALAGVAAVLALRWVYAKARGAFADACGRCFDEVDADGSGAVDGDELYVAVLLSLPVPRAGTLRRRGRRARRRRRRALRDARRRRRAVAAPAVAAVLVLVALPAALDAIDGLAARDAPGPAVIVIDDGEAMTPTTPEPTTPPTKPKTPDSVRAARSPVRFAPDVKGGEAPRRGIFRKISTTRFIKLPKASSRSSSDRE